MSQNHVYIGVDVGLRRLSVAGVDDRGRFAVHTRTSSHKNYMYNLWDLRKFTDELAWLVINELGYFPSCIVVEQPSGKFRNLKLNYAAGVVIETLCEHWGPYLVELPPATWKKHAIGKGNANKADHMEKAQELGYTGDIEDEADAVCIALAAREITDISWEDPDASTTRQGCSDQGRVHGPTPKARARRGDCEGRTQPRKAPAQLSGQAAKEAEGAGE